MGYLISSLTDPYENPRILRGYCIYLVHEYQLKGIAQSLSSNFRAYSTRLGPSAAIIAASNQEEYNESFAKLIDDNAWFKRILGDYDSLPPGIIIAKPGLPRFKAHPGDVFIFVSEVVLNLAYHNPHELSQDLVDLCRYNNRRFISRILKYSRGSIAKPGPETTSILETLSKSIMIEPNFYGIGIKPKPILQRLTNAIHKSEKKPKYDCVIYQF